MGQLQRHHVLNADRDLQSLQHRCHSCRHLIIGLLGRCTRPEPLGHRHEVVPHPLAKAPEHELSLLGRVERRALVQLPSARLTAEHLALADLGIEQSTRVSFVVVLPAATRRARQPVEVPAEALDDPEAALCQYRCVVDIEPRLRDRPMTIVLRVVDEQHLGQGRLGPYDRLLAEWQPLDHLHHSLKEVPLQSAEAREAHLLGSLEQLGVLHPASSRWLVVSDVDQRIREQLGHLLEHALDDRVGLGNRDIERQRAEILALLLTQSSVPDIGI